MNVIANVSIAAVVICLAAPAQSSGIQPVPTLQKAMDKNAGAISVHYEGGTLAGFLDLIRKQNPSVNIVTSPAAKDVEVPELKIQKASLYAALRAVASIAPSDYQVSVNEERSGLGQPVYSVRVRYVGQGVMQQMPGSGNMHVQVFSLKNMITLLPGLQEKKDLTLKADTILLAIETGLGVEGAKNKATIRYHEASGLLFVRGTSAQLSLVQQITMKLEGDLRDRRNAAQMQQNNKRRAATRK